MLKKEQQEKFYNMLIEQKESIIRSIEDKTDQINNLYIDENPGDESDRAEASSVEHKEKTIITSQQDRLKQINYALDAIKKGTYGTCEMCDEKISIARLKAKPFAKYCIDCREYIEKKQAEQEG